MKSAMFVFVLVSLVVPACQSGAEQPAPVLVAEELPDWLSRPAAYWDPSDEPYVVWVVGRSTRQRGMVPAEELARKDARARIETFLRDAVARMDGVTAQPSEPGDVEGLVGTASRTAPVKGKWWDDDTFWIWMKLDAGVALLDPYVASRAGEVPVDRLRGELERAVREHNETP